MRTVITDIYHVSLVMLMLLWTLIVCYMYPPVNLCQSLESSCSEW